MRPVKEPKKVSAYWSFAFCSYCQTRSLAAEASS